MLPFLKNKEEGSVSGPVETKVRAHDEGYDMLDAVADDLLAAFASKDKATLKAALSSLCDYIKGEDAAQDQEMLGE